MADLLKIKAKNGNGLMWKFIGSMDEYKVVLDKAPTEKINDGDVWQVELVSSKRKPEKVAIVRLIARVQKLEPWATISSLPDYWIDLPDLQDIVIWLNTGSDIILKGPKGVGKTTLAFKLAQALGWQNPYKVDTYTIKRTTDLFGTDAARKGSTLFVRSGLLDYIERAVVAHTKGIETHFLMLFDEINRVHAKSNESLHGLFDDTRQITIPTAEGSKTIILPPNLHTIGTMNIGSEYVGTHALDDALKDRFEPMDLKQMPIDYEVKKLALDTKITEKQALDIVQVARALREAAAAGLISTARSYRGCRSAARLVHNGVPIRRAIIRGLLGWLEGDLTLDGKGEVANPNSEKAKAFSALRAKGVAKVSDLK